MRRNYPEKPDKVYFMGTCLADMLYAEAGMAGIHLLEREGVKVIYPRDQTCCGQPAFNSGFQEEALEVALHRSSVSRKRTPSWFHPDPVVQ